MSNPIYKNSLTQKENKEKILPLLDAVFKPGRYLGTEPNTIHKIDQGNDLYRFNICYPDLYEIGMSNLSIKILYFLLNKSADIWAERVFLPDNDMIKTLEESGTPLFSLESWNFVKKSNCLGFTVHTELIFTNIIKILCLSGLSPYREKRTEDDPLVIAGGSNIFNPLPLADFIDLFFIGESEDIISSFVNKDWELIKKSVPKKERIKILSRFPGIYNPASGNKVTKIVTKNPDNSFYPETDILPFVKTIQDRPSVEIARGCNNGCRFCQAGFYYRPYREKKVRTILQQMKKILKNTGYDEINLVSLSVADYNNIVPLMKISSQYFGKNNISLSLPSLRILSFPIEILDSLKMIRKSGLTFAIEAGNKEIRDKINKEFDEAKLVEILDSILKKGWNLVKFYFIIGFPGIDNEDKIIDDFIQKLLSRFPKLRMNINLALFIPKAFTPLQNIIQMPVAVFLEKAKQLKFKYRRNRNIQIKYADGYRAYFEYYFSVSGTESGKLLVQAVENNIFREGWDEYYNKNYWEEQFAENPVIPGDLSFLNPGFTGDFLKEEYKKYEKGIITKNCCTDICYHCGVCFNDAAPFDESLTQDSFDQNLNNIIQPVLSENEISKLLNELESKEEIPYLQKTGKQKNYILLFNKTGLLKYVGHLDFYILLIRLLRKIRIDFIYSHGFNPMPRLVFPYPAPLKMESYDDILFIETKNNITDSGHFLKKLNEICPEGLEFTSIKEIESIKTCQKHAITLLYSLLPAQDRDMIISPDSLLHIEKIKKALQDQLQKDNQNYRFIEREEQDEKNIFLQVKQFTPRMEPVKNYFKKIEQEIMENYRINRKITINEHQ